MRAAATIVTGLALMVRISSALPASKSSLQLREYEDECTTNDDCGEKYECVKVGGKSRFVGLWGDYGSMPEHMACRESDECQTDDDCEGEFNICMDIAPKQCKPDGLSEWCDTDGDCIGDLVCKVLVPSAQQGQCLPVDHEVPEVEMSHSDD